MRASGAARQEAYVPPRRAATTGPVPLVAARARTLAVIAWAVVASTLHRLRRGECALIAVNLQTAFLSPPVAMSAYYLRNVVPQWSLATIYRGMADFMIIQVICLAAVLIFPDVAMWLPRALR